MTPLVMSMLKSVGVRGRNLVRGRRLPREDHSVFARLGVSVRELPIMSVVPGDLSYLTSLPPPH